MKKIFNSKQTCRLCNESKLVKVVKLPAIYPGEQLKYQIKDKVYKVPIDLYQCKNCWHVQIKDIPIKELMWNEDYTFMPSLNPKLSKHFNKTILEFKKRFKPTITKAFEVGSNDGLFLKLLKDHFNCRVLGMDPSKIPANKAIQNKIPTMIDFFDYKKSTEIKKKNSEFDLIIANNVYAHMDNLYDFTKGIKNLLKANGYFIFEISYLPDVIKKNLIGTIIHEHLSIHSITSLKKFFNKFNFHLVDVRHDKEVQGGALVGYAIHTKKKVNISKRLKYFLKLEKSLNLDNLEGMKQFNKDLKLSILKLKKKINKKFTKKEKFVAFGAARSAPIILELLGLKKRIKYFIDNNNFKDGKFMPIENIPIKHVSKHDFKSSYNYIITGWAQNKKIIKTIKSKSLIKQNIISIFPKFDVKKI